MTTSSSLTHAGGLWLFDRSSGHGDPMVFVHGLAVSSRYFGRVMAALSSAYHCRAVDLPGFGHSEDPPAPLDIRGLADALAAWLRANQVERAPLIGNSAGCQVIVDCVARHPDIRGQVVLIGPTTEPGARTPAAQIGRWLRTGITADIMQLPALVADCRDAGVRRIAFTFRTSLSHLVEAQLPQVLQPALVIRGAKDPLVSRHWAEQVAWLLPRGQLAEVRGGAHVVHLTRPRQVARLIDDFVKEGTQ